MKEKGEFYETSKAYQMVQRILKKLNDAENKFRKSIANISEGGWYESAKKHSQRKRLPILLPSKKVIERTLYFEKDDVMRSE